MSKVNVVEYSGTAIQLEAKTGLSVMQILRDNDIAGIIADCGGNLSCATCHVYVEESWLARCRRRTRMNGQCWNACFHRKQIVA